jgi:hypothetical protein
MLCHCDCGFVEFYVVDSCVVERCLSFGSACKKSDEQEFRIQDERLLSQVGQKGRQVYFHSFPVLSSSVDYG